MQKTSGGSTASSSEDVLGGDGDDVVEDIIAPDDADAAVIAEPRTAAGVPTLAADAAEDGCIADSHLEVKA